MTATVLPAYGSVGYTEDEYDAHGELRRSINPYDSRTTGTNFDVSGWLATFDPVLLGSREGRCTLTRLDPFLFAYVYLRKHMKNADDEVTFADAHFLWVRLARRLIGPARGPREGRRALVAPRSCAKSSWWFLFIPMWAGVHRHVRFAAAFADSGTQAELHLATFKQEMAGNVLLQNDYPEFCNPARRHTGRTVADNQNMLHTKSGFTFAAKGIDSTSLGMKMGEVRPDLLICHEIGTPIQYGDAWIPVEEHPSFQGVRESESRVVDLWGLPFPEVVTPEHRYWAKWINGRRAKVRNSQWVEADQLDTMHYIGYIIDTRQESAPAIPVWRRRIGARDEAGRVVGSSVYDWEMERLPEFDDPEFWWMVGLWWGDGHLGTNTGKPGDPNATVVGMTVAHTQPEVRDRLLAYLQRINAASFVSERVGCTQFTWSWADLAHWLRTWKRGNSRKEPPAWVERLPHELQRALMEGYTDADGYRTPAETRITSIYLPGLLAARRILARIGIASSIRKGPAPRLETFPGGVRSMSAQKYDLRWGHPQGRYAVQRAHIADGMLWAKVRKIERGPVAKFAPIKTANSQYQTAFGLSHNCDDMEPPEANYSPFQREKRLSTLQNAIMPLNELAKMVVVVGTVTMPGSIVHELVRHAKGEPVEDWVDDERFKTYHTRAIVTRPDGTRRSVWPGKWTLEYLESIEHTRSYKLNYDNDPKGRQGDYWSAEDIHYGVPGNITKWFLFLDPPVTVKTHSDFCGIVLAGYAPGGAPSKLSSQDVKTFGRTHLAEALLPSEVEDPSAPARLPRVCIVDGWNVKMTGANLREFVLKILGQYPQIQAVVLENNQGGSLWNDIFHDMPVRFVTYPAKESKEVRFARVLDLCQKLRVLFAKVMPQLEDQLLGFPRIANDDFMDAACAAALRLLTPSLAKRDGTIQPR
jgi:hypothetical protein